MQNIDNHTILPFKLVHLKPDDTEDAETLAHRHSYFELFIFEKEGKNHFLDFVDYKVKKQSMHLVMPGCIHLLKRNKHTKGFVLLFSEEFYHLNVKSYDLWLEIIPLLIQNGCSITLSDEDFKTVISLCNQIDKFKDNQIVSTYLHLIILIFQKSYEKNKTTINEYSKKAHQFRKLVEINYKKNEKSEFYANELNISVAHLTKIIKQTFAQSPSGIIKQRLLLEAKRLLFHNDYSSKEIAYSLGFNDDSYFTKFFKQNTNYTPSQFRLKSRENFK